MRFAVLTLMLLAGPALAQSGSESPMSGAEFNAYTIGKTLSYKQDGLVYGAEQYLDGKNVIWAFNGDQCIDGFWYETDPGLICFEYEGAVDGAQCWHFFQSANGLRAVFNSGDPPTELVEIQQSPDPLFCPGPEVGA